MAITSNDKVQTVTQLGNQEENDRIIVRMENCDIFPRNTKFLHANLRNVIWNEKRKNLQVFWKELYKSMMEHVSNVMMSEVRGDGKRVFQVWVRGVRLGKRVCTGLVDWWGAIGNGRKRGVRMGKSGGVEIWNEWGCENGEYGVLKLSEGLWKVWVLWRHRWV